ncbi:MAG TPA: hypothetical protein VMF50_08350 [Candidatus Binataceae bacterium]|nr:hypothetical protein [Candidatus Binataceae bacterium]
MTCEKAYDVAVEMYKHEHDRWRENAFVLLAGLASTAIAYNKNLPLLWALLIATLVSLVFLFLALTIRGSTDAWRETIRFYEGTKDANTFPPFQIFEANLRFHSHRKDFMCSIGFWRPEVFLSVTRLYTFIGFVLVLVFGAWFVKEIVLLWITQHWLNGLFFVCH